MKTYNPFNEFDIVTLAETTEVEPALFIKAGTVGVVMDKTVPDYYLVKFEVYGVYWVDGKHLIKK